MCLKKSKYQIFYFLKENRAVAALEFALLIPVLMMLLYGGVELTHYLQMHQKLDNATHTLSDLINQNLNLSADDLQTYADSVPSMLKPFDTSGYRIILTSIEFKETDTKPTTLWQYKYGETDGNAPSKVSQGKGEIPTLSQIELQERDQVLTVEMYLKYKPVLSSIVSAKLFNSDDNGVYKVIIARPRFGSFEFDPT